MLFGCIIFTLVIKVNHELFQKYQPKFFGNLLILSKKACEYLIFVDFYNKGEQILSVEFDFSKLKSLLNENKKCKLKFFITKNYYKWNFQ